MTTGRLDAQITRWLRWYPEEWRDENGEAIRGALLDQAEATGVDRLALRDRLGLAAAGVTARQARRRRGVTLVAAGLLVALAIWYPIAISWSPGLEAPGAFLGFSNPSVLALLVAVVAAGAAVFALPRAALILGAFAVALQFAFVVAGIVLDWNGPGWTFFFLLWGLIALVVAPFQRRRGFLIAVVAVVGSAAVVMLLLDVAVPFLVNVIQSGGLG